MPISDVIRMASHSHHYLAIYDKHTREPLHLGRAKRFASPGQRIVLYAQDRGCCWRTLKLPTMPSLSMYTKHGVVRRRDDGVLVMMVPHLQRGNGGC